MVKIVQYIFSSIFLGLLVFNAKTMRRELHGFFNHSHAHIPSHTPMYDMMSQRCLDRFKHHETYQVKVPSAAEIRLYNLLDKFQHLQASFPQSHFHAANKIIVDLSPIQTKNQALYGQVKAGTLPHIHLITFNSDLKAHQTTLSIMLRDAIIYRAELMKLIGVTDASPNPTIEQIKTIPHEIIEAYYGVNRFINTAYCTTQTLQRLEQQNNALISPYETTKNTATTQYKNNTLDTSSHTLITQDMLPSLCSHIDQKEALLAEKAGLVANYTNEYQNIDNKIKELSGAHWLRYFFSSHKSQIDSLRLKQSSLLSQKREAEVPIASLQKEIGLLKEEQTYLQTLVTYGKACEHKQRALEVTHVRSIYEALNKQGLLDNNGQEILNSLCAENSVPLICDVSRELTEDACKLLAHCGIDITKFDSFSGNAFQKQLFGQLATVLNRCGKQFVEHPMHPGVGAYARATAQSSAYAADIIRKGSVRPAIALSNLTSVFDQLTQRSLCFTTNQASQNSYTIELLQQVGGLFLGVAHNNRQAVQSIEQICSDFAQNHEKYHAEQSAIVLEAFMAPSQQHTETSPPDDLLKSIDQVVHVESQNESLPSKNNGFLTSWTSAVKGIWKTIVHAKAIHQSKIQVPDIHLIKKTDDMGLVTAYDQFLKQDGVAYTKTYVVQADTQQVVEKLGVDIPKNIEFHGNHVQHYVHHQLIESFNRIGGIPLDSPQVNGLLKNAAQFNLTGQKLLRENQIYHAIQARIVCDRILDFGTAVIKGGFSGAASAVLAPIHFVQGVFNLASRDPETIETLNTTFHQAASAMSSFIVECYPDIMLVASGTIGAPSIVAYRHKDDTDHFVKTLHGIWESSTPNERAYAISKFIVEGECLGFMGKIAGQAVEKGFVAGQKVISDISLVEKLTEEATVLVAKTQPGFVEKITELTQKETEILASGQAVNQIKGIAKLHEDVGKILATSRELELLEKILENSQGKILDTKYGLFDTRTKGLVKYIEGIEAAEKTYVQIRENLHDIELISHHTQIPTKIMEKIKAHLFYDEHNLVDGIRSFHADPDIAEAWTRLVKGSYVQSDLKLLLHEYAESLIMKDGALDYITAHHIINNIYDRKYNWSDFC